MEHIKFASLVVVVIDMTSVYIWVSCLQAHFVTEFQTHSVGVLRPRTCMKLSQAYRQVPHTDNIVCSPHG
jgi:hypothetical protein